MNISVFTESLNIVCGLSLKLHKLNGNTLWESGRGGEGERGRGGEWERGRGGEWESGGVGEWGRVGEEKSNKNVLK
ncbi:hypothetical protein LAY57_25660 [Argonema antarcticum A004/B2]|nr:hypothetical protein [Argonema antarcticum A004/B2]